MLRRKFVLGLKGRHSKAQGRADRPEPVRVALGDSPTLIVSPEGAEPSEFRPFRAWNFVLGNPGRRSRWSLCPGLSSDVPLGLNRNSQPALVGVAACAKCVVRPRSDSATLRGLPGWLELPHLWRREDAVDVQDGDQMIVAFDDPVQESDGRSGRQR